MNAKKSTLRNYQSVLAKFECYFGNIELTSITTDNILPFLLKISEGAKQSTKKLRYSLLSAFFNFIKTSFDPSLQNPCDSPTLRKLFREQKPIHWKIIEKDIIDEIIFRTENPRNRLMLVTDRYYGATHDRGSGATSKWPKAGLSKRPN